jgi:hypothetical protein
LNFNKARQASITQEIAEIAGGAAALSWYLDFRIIQIYRYFIRQSGLSEYSDIN